MTPKRGRKKNSVKFEEIENAISDNYKAFDFKFKKREFKFTEKQKQLIETINNPDTKIVLIEGPAGTSKSLMSVYCGLMQLKEGRVDSIMYLRSVVESAQKSMGYLPGSSNSKMSFFTEIIADKLIELVEPQNIPEFHTRNKIETMPLNYIRGCSWRKTFIIADEIQNFSTKEILSTMTRIGEGSVLVMCGDITQSDIRNSGFSKTFQMFDDEESEKFGIHTFKFSEDDIVRSEIVKYIVKKFNTIRQNDMK